MSFALLAAETVEHTKELPMSAVMFALTTLGLFAAMLGLVWAFRNSSHKHHR